jgi:hypothetical protein
MQTGGSTVSWFRFWHNGGDGVQSTVQAGGGGGVTVAGSNGSRNYGWRWWCGLRHKRIYGRRALFKGGGGGGGGVTGGAGGSSVGGAGGSNTKRHKRIANTARRRWRCGHKRT